MRPRFDTMVALLSLILAAPPAEDNRWVATWVFAAAPATTLRGEDGKSIGTWDFEGYVLRDDGDWIEIRPERQPGPYTGRVRKNEVVRAEDAVELFTAKLRTDPKNLWALRGRSRAHLRDFDSRDKALADAEAAVRLSPTAAVLNDRGWVRKERYTKAEAAPDFDAAIKLDPAHAETFVNRADCIRWWDTAAAGKDLAEAVRLDPNYVRAHLLRADLHVEANDLNAAIADYTAAHRAAPKCTQALTERGKLWLAIENPDEAVKDFTELIRLEPGSVINHELRGSAFLAKNNPDAALRDFDEMVRLEAVSWGRSRRARALADRGEYVAAKAEYEAVIDKTGDVNALAGLAWMLATCPDARFRDGKRAVQLGEEAWTRVVEMERPPPGFLQSGDSTARAYALNVLAAAQAETGNYPKAAAYQQDALDNKEFAREAGRLARERLKLYEQNRPYRQPAPRASKAAPPPPTPAVQPTLPTADDIGAEDGPRPETVPVWVKVGVGVLAAVGVALTVWVFRRVSRLIA